MKLDVGMILVGTSPTLRAVVLGVDRRRGRVTLRMLGGRRFNDFSLSLSAVEQGHTGWRLERAQAGEGGGRG